MGQQPPTPGKGQNGGVGKTPHVTGLKEVRTQQEIPIALHEVDLTSLGCLCQDPGAVLLEAGRGRGIVAYPDFEQVTEDDDGLRRRAG
jgi:hypothetical protein